VLRANAVCAAKQAERSTATDMKVFRAACQRSLRREASTARASDERVSGTKWSAPQRKRVLRANAVCAAKQADKMKL